MVWFLRNTSIYGQSNNDKSDSGVHEVYKK